MAMAGQLGILDKKYVSSINFLDQREILNKVLDITNEESSFLDIMELTNRSKVTSVPEYHHFVNEELYVLASVTAVTGSGVTGSPATITATIDAAAYAYVNVGELVLFPDGKVGYVSSKAGSNNIVIKSVDSSALTLVAADKISFFSNAAGEGSLSPASKRWGVEKYANQVQIFKGKFEVTDVQKASKVEVEFQGKPFFMYKGQHESLMKFRDDISAALIFGRKSSTLFGDSSPVLVDAESKPVQTTMGLDQYATSMGKDLSLLTAGQVALADIKALTQLLNKDRCPQEYFLFVGTTQNIYFDDLFNNLGNSALLSQGARFQIAGKEIEVGIDTIKIYGRTYYKKHLPILDHKNIVNFTGGYNAKDSAYGVPATKIKTNDGQMMDRLGVRYMAEGGTDFKYREILLGGLAPVPTSERSVLEIHYESIQGLEVLGAQQIFKLK
jgi:hypothetical protein